MALSASSNSSNDLRSEGMSCSDSLFSRQCVSQLPDSPFRTDLRSDIFHYSSGRVEVCSEISVVLQIIQSSGFLFPSVSFQTFHPLTKSYTCILDSSVRCLQPFCSHFLSSFSPSTVGDSLEYRWAV